ncbi:MAG: hypothetical protein KAW93_00060 [Methanogenium sp.]|nr:hypothetical protein [Methanogenium sp.]
MERLNDEGQWIVLMGFLVSVGIFFLAFVLSQSTLVGQTTSDAVLEFPKNEIRDYRAEVIDLVKEDKITDAIIKDLKSLELHRNNAVVNFTYLGEITGSPGSLYDYTKINISFNNGLTRYKELCYVPKKK